VAIDDGISINVDKLKAKLQERYPYKWEYRECHALLKPGEQGGEQEEIPF
jgi:hypothetical protein